MNSSFRRGVRRSPPILLGYAPVGMAYGLLAQQTGIEIGPTLGLSLFVFAGASQFVAVSMLHSGSGVLVIIGTAFVVNFRHFLMSAAIAPRLAKWKIWQRLALGGMLTDESFALHSLYFAQGDLDPTAAITLNSIGYVVWVMSSAVGHRLGVLIENPKAWGLDFALPAMFVGLLLPSCRDKPAVTAALTGGAASVILSLLGAGSWAAFLGALAGATVGTVISVTGEAEA
ncbi:MAG: AzlC family ABC transporter permease [Synergistaceae bacterium]|nr:AzlC family ABC transporter permease [Synergistaceae bacterium]